MSASAVEADIQHELELSGLKIDESAPSVEEFEQKIQKVEEDHPVIQALSDEQKACLRELRKRIEGAKGLPPRHARFCTDRTLCRYLRARNYNVEKAEAMLRETLHWFDTEKPHLISPQTEGDIEPEARTGKVYRFGQDLLGRPVMYMRPVRENTKNTEKQFRHLIYNLLRACDESEERGAEQIDWLVDFKGFSLTNAPPMKTTLDTIHVLSTHFCERLGHAFVVDPPFIFNMFWKAVFPFLNDVTRSKIVFCKSTDAKVFSKYFDPSKLEKQFAPGTATEVYDHSVYWPREIEKDKVRMAKIKEIEELDKAWEAANGPWVAFPEGAPRPEKESKK